MVLDKVRGCFNPSLSDRIDTHTKKGLTMLDEMKKPEFIDAMLSDENTSWTATEAGALFERMTETYQLETHTLADIKADWLSFDSGIKALEYFMPHAEHGNDEEYAGEWLHELTGTVYDIIWHDSGVLVSPCVWQ